METNTVKEILSNVSMIAACVAIVSAIVSSIITAKINKDGEYKARKMELFFHEKVDAYTVLFSAIDSLGQNYTMEGLAEVTSATAKALLFAPENTRDKISEFVKAASASANYLYKKDVSQAAISAAAKTGKLRLELLQLLHDDLLVKNIK